MREISTDEREILNYNGIKGKFCDESILDYPKIKKWMKSSEGELFLSGKKDLVLHGGWEAYKIGVLMQRWFILTSTTGSVLDLLELNERLKEGETFLEEDCRPTESIFISGFQEGMACPLDSKDIYRISRHIKERHASYGYSRMVLHVAKGYSSNLLWWPNDIEDFVINNCLWIDCD